MTCTVVKLFSLYCAYSYAGEMLGRWKCKWEGMSLMHDSSTACNNCVQVVYLYHQTV